MDQKEVIEITLKVLNKPIKLEIYKDEERFVRKAEQETRKIFEKHNTAGADLNKAFAKTSLEAIFELEKMKHQVQISKKNFDTLLGQYNTLKREKII